MKSYDKNFYDLLTQVGQTYIIPSFQRDYSWDLPQWEVLWKDIRFLLANPEKYHYTGSIVYIPSETHSSYLREIIDGQQRLTTISIIYLATYDLLREEKLRNYNPDRLRVQVLANDYNDVEAERLKLKPAGTDGEIYKKLIDSRKDLLSATEKGSNLYRCYRYFKDQLLSEVIEVEDLINAARRLQVIEIVLNQNDDHPQKVFESINSTGKQLNVGDLIRNYILMRGTYDDREKLYSKYWVGIENSLKSDNKNRLEDFFSTYIRIRKEQSILSRLLYESFKSIYDSENDVDAFLREIQQYVGIYEFMKFNRGVFTEDLKPFRYAYDVLNFLKIEVLDTFLMQVLKDCIAGLIPQNRAVRIHEFVINYLSRRIIVGKPTASLNKYAPSLYSKIRKYGTDEIDDVLIYEFTDNMSSHLAYPSDAEVKLGIKSDDFYGRKDHCKYILLSIDNSNLDIRNRNSLNDPRLTIEHVMPQTLSTSWKESLGSTWSEVHEKYLNKLANLTLTAYNSSYSNRSFSEKLHNSEGTGLADSPLLINQFFKKTDTWNEAEILKRQDHVERKLLEIFPAFKSVNKYAVAIDLGFYPIDKIGDPTGQKPDSYTIFGQKFNAKTWQQFYIDTINSLADLIGVDKIIDEIYSWGSSGTGYINTDESTMRAPKKLSSGHVLECNMSSKHIIIVLVRLFKSIEDVDCVDVKVKLKD